MTDPIQRGSETMSETAEEKSPIEAFNEAVKQQTVKCSGGCGASLFSTNGGTATCGACGKEERYKREQRLSIIFEVAKGAYIAGAATPTNGMTPREAAMTCIALGVFFADEWLAVAGNL